MTLGISRINRNCVECRKYLCWRLSDLITHKEIPDFYDWLSRYVQVANWMFYRDRFASFTMHKKLSVPDGTENGRKRTAGLEHVNNRLLEAAQISPQPRVLDAGCGFGGTIFHWHSRLG